MYFKVPSPACVRRGKKEEENTKKKESTRRRDEACPTCLGKCIVLSARKYNNIQVPGKRFTCAATKEREINDRISRARKREYEEDDLLRGSANCYRQNIPYVRGYIHAADARALIHIYK
uniref:Uncharacterized protein n=1 Tax=Trichogramma kaykai TaxID=54128 RepID=A0ABD2WHM8_9HYME